jgi:hypothetical protein
MEAFRQLPTDFQILHERKGLVLSIRTPESAFFLIPNHMSKVHSLQIPTHCPTSELRGNNLVELRMNASSEVT